MGWSENGYPQHLMVYHHVSHNVAILEIYHMLRQTQIIEKNKSVCRYRTARNIPYYPKSIQLGKTNKLGSKWKNLIIGVVAENKTKTRVLQGGAPQVISRFTTTNTVTINIFSYNIFIVNPSY